MPGLSRLLAGGCASPHQVKRAEYKSCGQIKKEHNVSHVIHSRHSNCSRLTQGAGRYSLQQLVKPRISCSPDTHQVLQEATRGCSISRGTLQQPHVSGRRRHLHCLESDSSQATGTAHCLPQWQEMVKQNNSQQE